MAAGRTWKPASCFACAPQLLRERRISAVRDLEYECLIVDTRRLDLWDRWAALPGIDSLRPRQEVRLDSMAASVHDARCMELHQLLTTGAVLTTGPVGKPWGDPPNGSSVTASVLTAAISSRWAAFNFNS